MDDVIALEAKAWRRPLAEVGAPTDGRMVVCGPRASDLAAAWHLLGYGHDRTVFDDEPVTAGRADEHSGASFVALVHAWAEPQAVETAARTAARWLRPGGLLLLAELEVDRLSTASPQAYLSSIAYRMFPQLADQLRSLCVDTTDLVAAAIRTGLDGKQTADVDRPRTVYGDGASWGAVMMDGWRGVETLTDEQVAMLRRAVATQTPPSWPFVDREPWVVVAGRARR